jgi:DNA-binding response OmpR family regulator
MDALTHLVKQLRETGNLMRIVVAEKDAALAEFIKEQLEAKHYAVDVAPEEPDLLTKVAAKRYDLAIVDLESPCFEILRKIREIRPELLLVVLSGKNDPETHLACLDAGADDFIPKPFHFSVLGARFRALWRRRNNASSGVLALEDLELNRIRRTVKRNGCPVELTQKEFALLEFLMERPMQPVSRAVIAENAWHIPNGDAATNTVDVYINYIRKKLNFYGDQQLIRTVRGVGYQIGGAEPRRQDQPSAND